MSELFKALDPYVPEARALDMSIISIKLNHVPVSEPITEARGLCYANYLRHGNREMRG